MSSLPPPLKDSPAARQQRAANPHRGWCVRCGFNWTERGQRVVTYRREANCEYACFPLCNECFDEADIEELAHLFHYYATNTSFAADEVDLIVRAAIAEKLGPQRMVVQR